MNARDKYKLASFNEAKKIALSIEKGHKRRALLNKRPTSYVGFKDESGRMFVIGDSNEFIQNPDVIIDNKPAREIFGDFTTLIKY